MIRVVFGAFLAAILAHVGAEFAHALGEGRAAGHLTDRIRAGGSAREIEFDAACHFGDVAFVQAGGGAVVTSGATIVAGFNAGLVSLVGHGGVLSLFGFAMRLDSRDYPMMAAATTGPEPCSALRQQPDAPFEPGKNSGRRAVREPGRLPGLQALVPRPSTREF
jgi:hypothetical protein